MRPTVIEIARVAHEANRAYCLALGDTSQPAWDDAPDWQRESAINGVIHLLTWKATPEDSHAHWLAQKSYDGWVYGPEKDPVARTHPCMVPYDKLPPEQQVKDHLFFAVVRALK